MAKIYTRLKQILLLSGLLFAVGIRAEAQTYCNSSFTNVNWEHLTNVTFGTINNTTIGITGGPVDYTSMSTNVTAGNSYPISVTILADGSEYIYAFIDWNHNGTLSDAGEVYTIASSVATNGPHTLSIAVPSSALPGNTRMRVMLDYGNSAPDPCRNATYGEAEDYTLVVTNTATCFPSSIVTATATSSSTGTATWNAASPAPANGYDYYYSLSPTAPTASTTPSGSTAAGVLTASLTTLTANSVYYVWVRSKCSANDISGWSGYDTMYVPPTAQTPATLPYIDPFTTNNWTLLNTGQTNKWYVGSATGNPANSLYISSDLGVTNTYNNSVTSTVHAYRDITFPAGSNNFSLQFDWKNMAEQCCDYVKVWIVPTSFIPTPGTQITAGSGRTQYGTNLNNSATWVTQNYILPASLSGTTARLVFEWYNDGSAGSDPAAIDNVNISIITCGAPTNPVASNAGTTTATVSWTPSAPLPANGYEYYYSSTNTPPTASTTPSGSTGAGVTTASLTGLTPNTTYYVWVRALCGPNNISTWSATNATFITQCLAINAPWTYTVETHAATSSGAITDCWSATPNNTSSLYRWDVSGSGTTPSSSTGPSSAYSGSKFFYTEASYGSLNDSAKLVTPTINVSTITNPALQFYYHMYGSTMGNLYTQISTNNGSTWTTIDSIIGQQQTTQTAAWIQKTIPLTGYSGNISIRFVGKRGSDFYGDMAIDNISVGEMPSCLPPNNVLLSNATSSQITVNWSAPSPAPSTGYQYFISTTSTAPVGTTTPSGSVASGTTTNIGSLTANTQYYVWVRSNCGTSTSSWAAGGSILTACNPITTLPWTENFDAMTTVGSNIFPSCWTKQNGDWATGTSFTNSASPYSPTKALSISWSATNEFIWTPGFQLTAGISYDFSFMYAGDNYSSWVGDIFVNTTANSSGATQLGSSFITTGTTVSSTSYLQALRAFTPTTTGTYYFAIRVNEPTGSPWYLVFDNFKVEQSPTCQAPTGITGSVASSNSMTINWTAPTTPPANGYQYYYSTTNTAPTASTTPSGSTAAGVTTVTIGSLTTGSTYYVWVRSNCSSVDKSSWTGPATVIINYCSPAPTSVDGSGITNVMSGSFSNPTLAETNNYGNYTNLSIPAYQGVTKYIDIELTTGISYETKIWVDWNNDLDFTDPGEEVWLSPSQSPGNTVDTVHASFLVPANATLGAHRMRIGGYDFTGLTPCFTGSWASFEDYTLTVNACSTAVNLGNDTAICAGGTLNLNAGYPGATYLWSTTDTTQSISVTTSGTYHVLVTEASGCSDRDTVVVTVNPVPTVNLGNDTAICSGNSLTLNAGNAGATYLWSTAATTQSISVTASGTYWSKVTNANGCFSYDTVVVTVNPVPTVALGNDTSFCVGDSITLNAGNAGMSFLWSNGDTTQTITASASGTYWAKVTNTNGCFGTDTLVVTVNPLPVVNLGNNAAICENDTMLLDAGNAGATYLWSDNSTAQTLEVTDSGTYWVTVTNANGCSATDSISLNLSPLPTVDSIQVTQGGNYTRTFTAAGATNATGYLWDFGDGSSTSTQANPTHTFAAAGTYEVCVTVSNQCGSVTVCTTIVIDPISVKDIALSNAVLFVYPNPANHSLTIKNESTYNMEKVEVYNIVGQKLMDVPVSNGKLHTIDVSKFASGMYQLRISMGDAGTVTRKFEVIK